MDGAAAQVSAARVTTPPPAPTCPVCLEPWNCNGDHRICCIPCGHVYGRSCLERWLHRSGDSSAKCPQCGEQFDHDLIINLYAPGNLWDGCCRLQEVSAHYLSELRKIQEERARSQCCVDELKRRFEESRAKDLERDLACDGLRQKLDHMERMWRTATTMIERMSKMAEEEKATANMESLPQHSSVSAPALVDSQNNTRQLRNRLVQLPPVPAPPGPADGVKKRRHPNRADQPPPVPAPCGPADAVMKRRRGGT